MVSPKGVKWEWCNIQYLDSTASMAKPCLDKYGLELGRLHRERPKCRLGVDFMRLLKEGDGFWLESNSQYKDAKIGQVTQEMDRVWVTRSPLGDRQFTTQHWPNGDVLRTGSVGVSLVIQEDTGMKVAICLQFWYFYSHRTKDKQSDCVRRDTEKEIKSKDRTGGSGKS